MKNINQPSGELAEPLTRRDLDILKLLVQDLPDREIASRLTLALSTVKWYARQVYAKLGVSQRSQVAERAYALGLLQPRPTYSPFATLAKNNLPAQLTSFIGREREVIELRRRLTKNDTRLFTLTGSGGTGKTRLALRVAADLLDTFPDGVWLVELAPLSDPLLIPQIMIKALGLVEQPDRTSIAFLTDYLREKHLLLILDNCEHLVEACAELVVRLLLSAPGLTILLTSREILGVAGEMPFRLNPLEIPDHPRQTVGELARYNLVRLFVARAGIADPSFVMTEENAAEVAQITRQLDGIPLALELAAARVGMLSVGQIVLRLQDAFHLLTGGCRSALLVPRR